MSFPTVADMFEKMLPASCMPSPEFIAVHTLSADDTFRFVGDFQGLPVTGHHIEIIADSISQMAA